MMAVRQSGNLLVYWTYRGPSIWLQVNNNHHHRRRRLHDGHHHQPPPHHHDIDIIITNVFSLEYMVKDCSTYTYNITLFTMNGLFY